MKGAHSFLFLPRPLPFTDSPAVYSLRSWVNTIRDAMQQPTPHPTLVTLAIQSRFDSPSPMVLPILDRRFELDSLRKYLTAVRIVPDLSLFHRDEEGNILPDRLPTPCPLMVFFYASTSSFSSQVSNELWLDPSDSPAATATDDDTALHVILNIATPPTTSSTPLKGLRILMVLNGMAPDEASTNFRNAGNLQYPADFVPIVRMAAPESHTIADYHVPPFIVQRLAENTQILREYGVEWAVMSDSVAGSFIVNHLPRKSQPGSKPLKRPSPEVRDSLLAVPAIAELLGNVILLSKWDVWIRPHPGVSIELLAAQLQNLDDLQMTDAAQMLKVRVSSGPPSVSPPDVLASYPARILPTTVVAEISQLIPVVSHQPTQKPGLLLLRVQNAELATIMYGVKVPTRHGFITLTTGIDSGDTFWEKSHNLSRGASLEDRKPLIAAHGAPFPPLTKESLMGLQASLPHSSGNEMQ